MKKIYLAPMEDVTDPAFRMLCKRYGADRVYTEFVNADALVRDVASTTRKLTIHEAERPVAIQIYGRTYRNASFANAIPEQGYAHPEVNVYGVLFDLEGNTASSCQFFVTDSTHHFFRASVYCNCSPNADSLAPVYNYLREDVRRMVESFEWK